MSAGWALCSRPSGSSPHLAQVARGTFQGLGGSGSPEQFAVMHILFLRSDIDSASCHSHRPLYMLSEAGWGESWPTGQQRVPHMSAYR